MFGRLTSRLIRNSLQDVRDQPKRKPWRMLAFLAGLFVLVDHSNQGGFGNETEESRHDYQDQDNDQQGDADSNPEAHVVKRWGQGLKALLNPLIELLPNRLPVLREGKPIRVEHYRGIGCCRGYCSRRWP